MVFKRIVRMAQSEYQHLCAFLEWSVKNPPICNNCPHFSTWEKIACCGCPEQGEYEKTYKSMPGYEISKHEGLKDFCDAYKAHFKASMRLKSAQMELEESQKELTSAREKLDSFYKEITISDILSDQED